MRWCVVIFNPFYVFKKEKATQQEWLLFYEINEN